MFKGWLAPRDGVVGDTHDCDTASFTGIGASETDMGSASPTPPCVSTSPALFPRRTGVYDESVGEDVTGRDMVVAASAALDPDGRRVACPTLNCPESPVGSWVGLFSSPRPLGDAVTVRAVPAVAAVVAAAAVFGDKPESNAESDVLRECIRGRPRFPLVPKPPCAVATMGGVLLEPSDPASTIGLRTLFFPVPPPLDATTACGGSASRTDFEVSRGGLLPRRAPNQLFPLTLERVLGNDSPSATGVDITSTSAGKNGEVMAAEPTEVEGAAGLPEP